MVTVQTRYIGPTNSRGSRIKAYSEAFPRGVTVSYDHALNSEDNHHAAAEAFIRARGWWDVWVFGGSADKRGNTYVCVAREHTPEQSDRARKVVRALQLAGTEFLWVRP